MTEAEVQLEVATPNGAAAMRIQSPVAVVPTLAAPMLREGYAEIVTRLESLIEAQVVAAQAIVADKDLESSELNLIYAIDMSGQQESVCANCSDPQCQRRATTYRVENPNIDLLADSLTVFLEVATRLGANYGVIAYDEDVIPLRELRGPSPGSGENSMTVSRFLDWKNRHELGDPGDRGWLDKMLDKWVPSDRVRPRAGEPDDRTALSVAKSMFERNGGDGPQALIVSKGLVPTRSLKVIEHSLEQAGITPFGIAVGSEATQIARNFFTQTDEAADAHEVRQLVGRQVERALSDESI